MKDEKGGSKELLARCFEGERLQRNGQVCREPEAK